jgi:hypothetical protein
VEGAGLEGADGGFLGAIIARGEGRRQQVGDILGGEEVAYGLGDEVGAVVGFEDQGQGMGGAPTGRRPGPGTGDAGRGSVSG